MKTDTIKKIWSGTLAVPAIGDLVEVSFPKKAIKGFVIDLFETQSPEATYIGVSVELAELPEKAENTGWGTGLLSLLEARGPKGFIDFALDKDSNVIYAYGSEVSAPSGPAPTWYEKFGLGSNEELAALAPIILGGKDWQDQLSITAWSQGQWEKTPYSALQGELQRIRNSAHFTYIDWVVKKHSQFIKAAKKALATYKAQGPKVGRSF